MHQISRAAILVFQQLRVRVRVSEDLIFDCENANTPLHGESTKIFITLRIFITLMNRDHQCINISGFNPHDFVKVGYRGKGGRPREAKSPCAAP